MRVVERPQPKVRLGPVDSSCSIVVCDLNERDAPIVYVSEAFTKLTGYHASEVVGKNCRFLQFPRGEVSKSSRRHIDKDAVSTIRRAVKKRDEIQTEVVNFRKDGTRFVNILTIIPVSCDGRKYAVGFQVERDG
jgi:PAS domain S-box-containing protein